MTGRYRTRSDIDPFCNHSNRKKQTTLGHHVTILQNAPILTDKSWYQSLSMTGSPFSTKMFPNSDRPWNTRLAYILVLSKIRKNAWAIVNHIIYTERNNIYFVVRHREYKKLLNRKKCKKYCIGLSSYPYFLALVWCMKVSRESSRAYMKLVWWMGDWVPAHFFVCLCFNFFIFCVCRE